MCLRRSAFVLLCFISISGPSRSLFADQKSDLERMTPVPATEKIPLVDFFRSPFIMQPTINRAGTHVAAIVSDSEDHTDLMVLTLDTNKVETVRGWSARDVYSVGWLDDRRAVFALSHQKLYIDALFAVNVGALNDSYPLIQYSYAQIVGIPENDRLRPLVWIPNESFDSVHQGGVAKIESSDLWKASLNAVDKIGEARESNIRHIVKRYAIPEEGQQLDYFSDKNGDLAFAVTGGGGYATLWRFADEKWIKCPVDLDYVGLISAGEKPGETVVLGPREAGKPMAVRFMDATTGKPGDVILEDSAYDFNGSLYRHPVTKAVLGVTIDRALPHVVWFSEAHRAIQKILDGYFPKLSVRLLGSDKDEKRLLISAFSDRQPASYYWVDLEKRTLNPIKSSRPWIDPARMRPMGVMKFKTRDGHALEAYITLPAGASKQNPAPLVVLPHGGPWVRDTWGFDSEVQFLASRGYAVLQPNYRGSTGYDWMFPYEDRWAFRKMHDDVTDAVKTLVATGYVDPARIGIAGASFGAYLAVSGVVNEPDLYRCCVALSGVYDWEQVMTESKFYEYDDQNYAVLKRRLGDPKKDSEKFDAISPVRHIDRVRVPVFVAHGKDDSVADVAQARRLLAELDKHHVEHEELIVAGESHGMSRLDDRLELYSRIEAFLAKYLPPSPTPAAQ